MESWKDSMARRRTDTARMPQGHPGRTHLANQPIALLRAAGRLRRLHPPVRHKALDMGGNGTTSHTGSPHELGCRSRCVLAEIPQNRPVDIARTGTGNLARRNAALRKNRDRRSSRFGREA